MSTNKNDTMISVTKIFRLRVKKYSKKHKIDMRATLNAAMDLLEEKDVKSKKTG